MSRARFGPPQQAPKPLIWQPIVSQVPTVPPCVVTTSSAVINILRWRWTTSPARRSGSDLARVLNEFCLQRCVRRGSWKLIRLQNNALTVTRIFYLHFSSFHATKLPSRQARYGTERHSSSSIHQRQRLDLVQAGTTSQDWTAQAQASSAPLNTNRRPRLSFCFWWPYHPTQTANGPNAGG